jgi:hypothetical protein
LNLGVLAFVGERLGTDDERLGLRRVALERKRGMSVARHGP